MITGDVLGLYCLHGRFLYILIKEGRLMLQVGISAIFKYLIIGIVYIIIFTALIIMAKDIKVTKKRKPRKSFGLEVLASSEESNIEKGSVIPVHREILLGRKESGGIILIDPFVSSHHARIFIRNDELYIEDLGSTNGTFVNEEKIYDITSLRAGDKIRIGSFEFKVIG